MNNKIKNTFRTGIWVAAGLVAMYSCSDTWDEHYNGTATVGTKFEGTTMQAIEQQAPDFAEVVRAAGFARELNSSNTYTVWAPVSGFDKAALIAKAQTDSAYIVKRFIQNHIARYNVSLGLEPQQVQLLNTKQLTMTGKEEHKIGEVNISPTQNNIKCDNGILHIVDGQIPFQNNIFELIEEEYANSANATKAESSLYAFLKIFNQDSLLENKSVSRGVDENGDKIWVDSVTLRNNTVLKNVDALIYEEDSSYIAIIPTIEAFQKRYSEARNYLTFNPSLDATEAELGYIVTDSLQNYYANMFSMNDLFFNRNANEHWEDSLKSTIYSALTWPNSVYYRKAPRVMPLDMEVNDLLEKVGIADSIDCSNGIAYLVDEYPMSIYEQYFHKLTVKANSSSYDNEETKGGNSYLTKNVGTASGWNFTLPGIPVFTIDEVVEDKTEEQEAEQESEEEDVPLYEATVVDEITKTMYFWDVLPQSNSVNPSIAFKIPNNLSGEYDIYLVTVPYWAWNGTSLDKGYRFNVNVWEKNDKGEYPSKGEAMVNPADGTKVYETPKLHYQVYKEAATEDEKTTYTYVTSDTTLLGTYNFKYAYYAQDNPGVIIQLVTTISSKLTADYSREMLISGFILKPHKESAASDEQPAAEIKMRNRQAIINNIKKTKYAALQ